MNLILLLVFVVWGFFKPNLPHNYSDDELSAIVIGKWKGEEHSKQTIGVNKFWQIDFFKDGHYKIVYKTTVDEEFKLLTDYKGFENLVETEEGKWFIKNGDMHEVSNNNEDIYQLEVINKNKLHYIMKSSHIEFEGGNYEFIDERVIEI